MDRKAISSAGGRALPAAKRAFSLDRDLAARAGRKGGQASAAAKDEAWHRAFLAKRGQPPAQDG